MNSFEKVSLYPQGLVELVLEENLQLCLCVGLAIVFFSHLFFPVRGAFPTSWDAFLRPGLRPTAVASGQGWRHLLQSPTGHLSHIFMGDNHNPNSVCLALAQWAMSVSQSVSGALVQTVTAWAVLFFNDSNWPHSISEIWLWLFKWHR